MAIDPTIPLQGNPQPDFLTQQRGMLSLRDMALRFKQQQAAEQAQNALRQIFANPANLDDKTGFPTSNAMNQIMAIDPNTGMQLRQNQLRSEQLNLSIAGSKADLQQKLQDMSQTMVRDPALLAYEEAKKAGLPEQAAQAAGQKAYSDGLEQLKLSGLASSDQMAMVPSDFNYQRVKSRSMQYKDYLARQDKERTEKRADTELGLEVAAGKRAAATFSQTQPIPQSETSLKAAATKYRQTGQMDTGLSREDQMKVREMAAGMSPPAKEFGAPTPVTVKAKDGTQSTVEAVYDKENAQWLTAQGRKPIEGDVLPAKEAREEAGVISDRSANFIADRILAGDPNATKNMSRTKDSMVKVENALTEKAIARWGNGPRAASEIMIATAGVKADQTSLSSLTKMTDAAVSFENTASKNFDLALSLAPKAIPTDWGPWLNRWIEQGETALGNKDVPPYVTAMLTGANEYAKIMSGSTGAQGSTVDSRREAAELFSPYLSRGQIGEVIKVAKADMNNRKKSLTEQMSAIKDRMSDEGGKQSASALPDAAKARLKRGLNTTFGNGQVWTLDDNGDPKQVK